MKMALTYLAIKNMLVTKFLGERFNFDNNGKANSDIF